MANKPTGRSRGRPRKVELDTTTSKTSQTPQPPILQEDGLALWEAIWTNGQKWLREDDIELVTQACYLKDEAEHLRRAISLGEVPRTYKLPNGNIITHPYINQLNTARAQLVSILSALGFTPTDRTRLGLIEIKGNSIIEEMKARRAELLNNKETA